ncbi:glycoside hydrolase family 31 protein [Schumannella soli]|uniref:Glycoside hydrolase n=1 Tax=Schumannella soli TaxID=2590779 RepID=A0A506XVJ0_9MICO|nr:glycoside hydrolase family 31 protein [Schumannella soli]TPW74186.1 glycoside hydrolase [Schumannella soli]
MNDVDVPLLADEVWWGGAVADGTLMPFGTVAHRRDLAHNAGLAADATSGANQSAPLLLSSAGRALWCDRPFAFEFVVEGRQRALRASPAEFGRRPADAEIRDGDGLGGAEAPLQLIETGGALRDAFLASSSAHFPAGRGAPPRELFAGPQYNTWIEMPYLPTQEAVLTYARGLIDAGFPPGVLMIDDDWAVDYGDWRFDRTRFPDPRAMTDELAQLGFRVMLWLVPFVSPDGAVFRELEERGMLLRGADGDTAIRRWWNGYSALLDVASPAAADWLADTLTALQRETGVSGFKFDGGDLRDFRDDDLPPIDASAAVISPVDRVEAWVALGARFPFNEFRASWRSGGLPLAQRLHDKPPTWGEDGLAGLIPEAIAQGLIGHPFVCPDMVGGGELGSFGPGAVVDQQQFVRYAQVAALFPMMQFSLSPARVLDEDHLAAVRKALALRDSLLPEILELVDAAGATGEPILRPLAYHHPGFEHVRDQFLLGERILVAPVLERGATSRPITLPPGTWQEVVRAADGHEAGPGSTHVAGDGGLQISVSVDLDAIPVLRRI